MTNALSQYGGNKGQQEPTVEQLLASIDLPPDFLYQLYEDSDWSLVIKLHAVFEAVLANLIERTLDAGAVADQISHLDFNHAKAGKVAFARGLGLLKKEQVSFLRGLSELRNKLVHRISNVSFEFKGYVASFSDPEAKKFRTEFGYAVCRLEGGEQEYQDFLKSNPRMIVYLAAYSCLLELQYSVSRNSRNLLVEALLQRTKE